MENNEYLASPMVVTLFTGAREDEDNNDDTVLLSHLNYAQFILNYLTAIPSNEYMEDRVPSVLFAVALSSLVSINTINKRRFTEVQKNMDTIINRDILVSFSAFFLFSNLENGF